MIWKEKKNSMKRLKDKMTINDGNWGDLRDVVANALECDIEVSEFELQSRHEFHFWTNTVGKL